MERAVKLRYESVCREEEKRGTTTVAFLTKKSEFTKTLVHLPKYSSSPYPHQQTFASSHFMFDAARNRQESLSTRGSKVMDQGGKKYTGARTHMWRLSFPRNVYSRRDVTMAYNDRTRCTEPGVLSPLFVYPLKSPRIREIT